MGLTFCWSSNIIIAGAESEVYRMSPRTGRPPKEIKKNVSIGLRISEETAGELQWCAEQLNVSRTEVIERGIKKVADEIKK